MIAIEILSMRLLNIHIILHILLIELLYFFHNGPHFIILSLSTIDSV